MPSLLTDPDGSEGRLILEDESSSAGRVFGSCRPANGEVVFNTGMVGYTEALTDPSYSGQILVLTYPLVGNYGVADSFESPKIQVAGLVVAELAGEYSHARARKSLPHWLCQEGIPCLVGVDTRALTKRLRERGCMLGKIVLQATNVQFEDPNRRNLVQAVSAGERKVYEGEGKTVVLVDCGVKASIIDELRARGLRLIRVPWNYDFAKED